MRMSLLATRPRAALEAALLRRSQRVNSSAWWADAPNGEHLLRLAAPTRRRSPVQNRWESRSLQPPPDLLARDEVRPTASLRFTTGTERARCRSRLFAVDSPGGGIIWRLVLDGDVQSVPIAPGEGSIPNREAFRP